MSEVRRQSPLLGFFATPRESVAGSAGVTAAERPFLGYVNLRGEVNDASFVDAARNVLGVDLPSSANTIVETEGLIVCWLGPDEWMVIIRPDDETEIIAALREALGGLHAAITDTTGGYTMLNLSGSRVRDLLAKGCTLDLHPRAFAPGQCAQTNLAKTSVLLLPRTNNSDLQSFDVVVRRSFADYLARWLVDSAREYGLLIGARSEPGGTHG